MRAKLPRSRGTCANSPVSNWYTFSDDEPLPGPRAVSHRDAGSR
jgi:hypothetical protein